MDITHATWLNAPDIKPYIYMRHENKFLHPGTYFKNCDWFKHEPIYKDPLRMGEVAFADQILNLESKAFQKSAMPMPRWVFYDCAVMPGFVCGFAHKTATLPESYIKNVGISKDEEWTPISLFIIIPTIRKGEWVAHNLCTANSLVDKADRLYSLGFLTKAFGLWYANVEILCGMTQWQSPAIKLHSHYGPFEILTAYTPVHSYAKTLTYRSRLDYSYWPSFFNRKPQKNLAEYRFSGFTVDPTDEASLKDLQRKIEEGGGPFYLDSNAIRTQALDKPLRVYNV